MLARVAEHGDLFAEVLSLQQSLPALEDSTMAARSIWNGTLAFGEVAIPVKLFSRDARTTASASARCA